MPDEKKSRPDVAEVYKNIDIALKYLNKTFQEIKKDFEFALGKQWKAEDVRTLEQAGVKAMTVNKIKPMLKLISGIERQSRSDYKAFPEGTEDELLSEISTRLLKCVSKSSKLKHKTSEQFKEGMTGGMCYIEPYIDYTYDLLNGELKFRKISANSILFDPSSQEYDLSDGKFLIKITQDLKKDDLLILFPDKEKQIDNLGSAKIDMDQFKSDHFQPRDYGSFFKKQDNDSEMKEPGYDLIEYYYKSPVNVYYVLSRTQGELLQTAKKEEADQFMLQAGMQGLVDGVLVTKKTNEIRLKQIVGSEEFIDETCPTYPKWKSYPIIPFFAERMTVDLEDTDLLIQGIVRCLRDLQEEYNKRRTQELRHLNSSVNSGMGIPKGALDRKNLGIVKQLGSSPGVVFEFDPEKSAGSTPNSWKLTPTPLSQGHAQLALENAQDIKEASGVNPDLLANDSTDQSGRAILLKQRQGLVMVQEALDNYAQTKEILGRFILSQLGEVFTVETAMQALGDGFIKENYKKPVFDVTGNPQLNPSGELETEPDIQAATLDITKVLSDSAVGKYDVTIGEGAYNETIQMANYMTLMDMVSKGIPIPPDVIIEESLLSQGQKEKVIESITKMQQAQAQMAQAQAMQPPPAEGMPNA